MADEQTRWCEWKKSALLSISAAADDWDRAEPERSAGQALDARKGWWGDNPPYHAPTFVLTQYEREPAVMEGGTTFFFVTGGIEEALERCQDRRRRVNGAAVSEGWTDRLPAPCIGAEAFREE